MNIRQLQTADDSGYLHLERYVNDGSPSGFTDVHTVSEATNPFTGAERFPLLQFSDKDLETALLGTDEPYLRGSHNFAHPDSITSEVLRTAGVEITQSPVIVSPASGGRTMVIRDGQVGTGFLKLTYDVSRIGRVDRQLALKHCVSSLEVSDTLKAAADDGRLTPRTAFLLEPSARVSLLPTPTGPYEWGTIFRERRPYPYAPITDRRMLIPGFSMFGTDRSAKTDRPLIVQMIEMGGYDPMAYLLDLLTMIVDSYWSIVHACALHIECHAQNCHFEVTSDWRVTRLVVKDMDSVDKDLPLARHLGVEREWHSDYLSMTEEVHYYPIRASYMYDFKLGEYLMTPLIKAVAAAFPVSGDDVSAVIREHVRSTHLDGLPPAYFPDDGCWYDCDNTERKPGTQRKYFPHPNPRFR